MEKNDEQLSSKVKLVYNSAMAADIANSSLCEVSDCDIIALLDDHLQGFNIMSIGLPPESTEKLHSEGVPAFTAEVVYDNPPFFVFDNIEVCIPAMECDLSGLTKTELYLYLFAYQTFGQAGADAMAYCIVDGAQSGSAV
jgi:hypothetical protein